VSTLRTYFLCPLVTNAGEFIGYESRVTPG